MTASAKKLLEEVLALSPEDQHWIAESIQQARKESAPVFTSEEMQEFERRAEELLNGSVEGIPIESVMSELRERIRGHETGHSSPEGRRPD